jgi:hypothetical protein
MAEETPREPEPDLEADQQDDVLGKIDQLLNRHRPKAFAAEAVPVLTGMPSQEDVPIDDGIPVLMDVVTGPGRPASPPPPASSRSSTLSSVLILRRMAIALDAEHIRLLAQIDRNDTQQARMLDRLVAELKRALPGAVRAALAQSRSAPSQPDDDGRL